MKKTGGSEENRRWPRKQKEVKEEVKKTGGSEGSRKK